MITNELLESALQYAGRGWHVFPLVPQGKTPLTKRGFKDAATDRQRIESWWRWKPQANVGIATGQVSRLFVLDIDPAKRGVETLRELVAMHAPLPPALTVRTGSGGWHLYYLLSERDRIGPSAADGLDVRCDGGYVVAPGSIHPNGTAYRWDNGLPLGVAPEWLMAWAAARKGETPKAPKPSVSIGPRPAWLGSPISEGLSLAHRAALPADPIDWHQVDRALDLIPASVGNDSWVAVGMALHATGLAEALEIWDEWSATASEKYVEGECAKRWASFESGARGIGTLFIEAKKYGYTETYEEPVKTEINGHAALPPQFTANPAQAIQFLDFTEEGKVRATCANTRIALRKLGIECRHDVFHGKMLVGGHPIAQWAGELSDHAVLMLRVMVRRHYGFDPGKEHAFDAAMQECLQHPFDPVVDWLDALKWDRVERLAGWLAQYMGAERSALNAQIARLALVAAVRRARSPGCKFDQIIVLEGPEGRGKSSAIEILAGADNFSDQSILTLDDRGQQEAVRGVWLYEIADMAGHARSENERIKAFASRTRDRARPAYGRCRVDEPRRCVFFATTNDEAYLRSLTGNRRFWPVKTGHIDLSGLARDRDQLWAEAAELERRGVPITLEGRLWGDVTALQASRQEDDPWQDILSAIAVKPVPASDGKGVELRISGKAIFEAWLQIPSDRQNAGMAKRVAFIMRRLGWDGPKPLREGTGVIKGYTKAVTHATPVT